MIETIKIVVVNFTIGFVMGAGMFTAIELFRGIFK